MKKPHKQLSQISWLGAKLDPIRASNLTQICIVADVITENFILGSISSSSGPAAFFSTLHLSN